MENDHVRGVFISGGGVYWGLYSIPKKSSEHFQVRQINVCREGVCNIYNIGLQPLEGWKAFEHDDLTGT